jgi:hypothetical protein
VQRRFRQRLTLIARALSLVAVAAFCLQMWTLGVASAQLAAGALLDPAVALAEDVHAHGMFAAHSHAHENSADGHVHDPVAPIDGDNQGVVDGPSWTLFPGTATLVPTTSGISPPDAAVDLITSAFETVEGIAPPGLIKPPSTPSIA